MRKSLLLILFLGLFIVSCDDDPANNSNNTNNTNNTNFNNTNNTNNTNLCEGEAPAADLQDGVCAGSVKICDGNQWVEPDYALLEDYETDETSCDGLDNDCDGITDENLQQEFFADTDNDTYGDANDSVMACTQPAGYVANSNDCDDTDNMHWSDCGSCIDVDGDGYGSGCDMGDDCDDTADTGAGCFDSCQTFYADMDGDTFGDANSSVLACVQPDGYVANPDDCDDNSELHHNDCGNCIDNDGDGYGAGCDAGADCDDSVITGSSCHDGCAVFYQDFDGDGYGNSSVFMTTCIEPAGYVSNNTDCNDNNPSHWNDCGACTDGDGDGYGAGCDLGPDCDDSSSTGAGCHNTCSTWYRDADGDTYGNPSVSMIACVQPTGYVADNTDCLDSSPTHWNDCTGCIDDDGDGYGFGCDLGDDCDDSVETGAACTSGCGTYYRDNDGDSYGNASASITACSQPSGYVTNSTDCNDLNANHWSDCGSCTDADGDNYGSGCDLGPDCDDTIATGTSCHNTCSQFYRDSDGDTYGNPMLSVTRCAVPTGYVANNGDCNDYSASHWSDCSTCIDLDGDNYGNGCNLGPDCDDTVETGAACQTGCNTFYEDSDGDTFGNAGSMRDACSQPAGYVVNSTDCDDTDNTRYPGNAEVCDGKDNNCNGSVDEGVTTTYYQDSDGDTFGNPSVSMQACSQPGGYVLNSGDCNDASAAHWNDCGTCIDADSDGYGTGCNLGSDCDDSIATGSTCQTGCATYYQDSDGDTFGNPSVTQMACVQPAGYVSNSTDCDDTTNLRYPGNAEVCDGLDNNCNGSVDEGVTTTYYQDSDNDGHGNASATTQACSQPAGYVSNSDDCDDTTNLRYPGNAEVCDGLDNNCNGSVDEGVTTTYYQDSDNDGHGNASATTQACSQPAGYVSNSDDCDDSDNTRYPGNAEVCDGKDNNCNGSVDEGVTTTYYQDSDNDGFGNPSVSTEACTQPANYVANSGDCDDSSNAHWNDCGICIDNDGDNYGAGCNLGADCDDNSASCHSGCGTYYQDSDGDTFGDPAVSVVACSQPAGYVLNNTDCGPSDNTVYPGALEICDGQDNNCDSVVDAGTCQSNASCTDDGGTVAAYCSCDANYLELPAEPGVCQEAFAPDLTDLAVTEVMIQAVNSNTPAEGQYFEIYNSSSNQVNLEGVGFLVDNFTEDASYVISTTTLLPSGGFMVVALTGDTGLNGGFTANVEFLSMPELNTTAGYIEIYRDSDMASFDLILWDDTWNHVAGKSLNLSPEAVFGADPATLNDDGPHWCQTRFTQLSGGDFGTPGDENDHCLIGWCNLQWPLTTTSTEGVDSENIYGQVYEPAGTEAAGAYAFIKAQLGWGAQGSYAGDSWTWIDATFNDNVGNNDEYMAPLNISTAGTYDYTYRMSMDGGLSWIYCDSTGANGHGGSLNYSPVDNGEITVTP